MSAQLSEYRRKRRFDRTPEPAPELVPAGEQRIFVVQKHQARTLHYDFRLELDGVLVSWAVPREPPPKTGIRRLAVHVEDHPVAYASFEGDIPKGQYGGGHVDIWDRGTWIPRDDPRAGLRDGHLSFELRGERLQGRYALIRMKPREGERRENWLLIRERDATPPKRSAKKVAQVGGSSAKVHRQSSSAAKRTRAGAGERKRV